ncbi:MAG: O-antigen ligase family protein [Pseudomonadota bacterium]
MAAFFVAPILFVTIELSPTTWAVVAALFGATASDKICRALYPPATVLLLALALVATSSAWSIDVSKTLAAARDTAGYSIAGLLLANGLLNLSERDCRRILKAFSAGCIPALIILVGIELFIAWKSRGIPVAQFHAITLHKITFYGAFFAILMLSLKTRLSIFIATVYAVSTLAFGRTTGINIAILLITIMVLVPEGYWQKLSSTGLVIYAAAALAAPVIALPLFRHLDEAGILAFYPGTFAARLEIWEMVSRHVWDAPVLGHGANTIRNATWMIVNPKFYVDKDLPSAHNIAIDLWFELGLIGVLAFLGILLALLRTIKHLRGPTYFVASAYFMTAIIELSVDHRIWLSWVLGTIIMAASVCILHHRSLVGEATS